MCDRICHTAMISFKNVDPGKEATFNRWAVSLYREIAAWEKVQNILPRIRIKTIFLQKQEMESKNDNVEKTGRSHRNTEIKTQKRV